MFNFVVFYILNRIGMGCTFIINGILLMACSNLNTLLERAGEHAYCDLRAKLNHWASVTVTSRSLTNAQNAQCIQLMNCLVAALGSLITGAVIFFFQNQCENREN